MVCPSRSPSSVLRGLPLRALPKSGLQIWVKATLPRYLLRQSTLDHQPTPKNSEPGSSTPDHGQRRDAGRGRAPHARCSEARRDATPSPHEGAQSTKINREMSDIFQHSGLSLKMVQPSPIARSRNAWDVSPSTKTWAERAEHGSSGASRMQAAPLQRFLTTTRIGTPNNQQILRYHSLACQQQSSDKDSTNKRVDRRTTCYASSNENTNQQVSTCLISCLMSSSIDDCHWRIAG